MLRLRGSSAQPKITYLNVKSPCKTTETIPDHDNACWVLVSCDNLACSITFLSVANITAYGSHGSLSEIFGFSGL